MKHTLAQHAWQVYWFAPGFSAKQLAYQLQPMSGVFLLFWLACFIHLHHTQLAGVTSYTAGCIFIHLRHRVALSQPHCAYNQKFGAPICSTLLDDFVSDWLRYQRFDNLCLCDGGGLDFYLSTTIIKQESWSYYTVKILWREQKEAQSRGRGLA